MSLKIVIVGGVAAGASAATRARRLNEQAEITIFEMGGEVSFANCGMPYYIGDVIKERDKLLMMNPDKFDAQFYIDALVHHEVTAIDRAKKEVEVVNRQTNETSRHPYDRLILTMGASPIIPPIPGVNASNVFSLRLMEDADGLRTFVEQEQPKSVVLVGGGFIGLEMAESLRARGADVTVLELADQLMPPFDPEMAWMLMDPLKRNGVQVHLRDGIKEIVTEGDKAVAVVSGSGKRIAADLVLLSIGVRPNVRLAQEAGLELGPNGGIRVNEQMQTNDPDILAAGDAVEVVHRVTGQPVLIPLAGPASRLGRLAGEFAATGKAPQAHTVLGTGGVGVFDRDACITGLSAKAAAKAGIEHRSVTIRRGHHVDYYPGAKEMALKLIWEPGTRRVLGAQAVGEAGVDKRIDVIATAIMFGATIDDLIGLDLVYAPQFGAAKDPVHIAAQAAMNIEDRLIETIDTEAAVRDPAAAGMLIDVRPPLMIKKKGAYPDAVNMPITELRMRLEDIPAEGPVTVACQFGQTSYIAARALIGLGRTNVRSLKGGYADWAETVERLKD